MTTLPQTNPAILHTDNAIDFEIDLFDVDATAADEIALELIRAHGWAHPGLDGDVHASVEG